MKRSVLFTLHFSLFTLIMVMMSCARMGNPDGGWYDETPPRVVGASPEDRGTGVKSNKVAILFSEYIKLENASEKVVISPPQMEQADIKAAGKRILVELKDSLKENTTYTIDFSDAISDNNEGNPMGNYTYSFSTGDHIDTLEVSGTVLEAENLEPIKGILVGLTSTDSIGGTMLRVSRTDSRGRFIIRGVAPGEYCCYALDDQDGNYRFTQRSEKMAFSHEVIVPSCKPDVRPDTIWQDSLRIKDILQEHYTHFLPDNVTLLAFTHELTDRFFLKAERKEPDRFTLFFSGAGTMIPEITLLNNDSTVMDLGWDANPFVIEASEKLDTITYWLRDTMLVNSDTLFMQRRYEMTDSLGQLVMVTDSDYIYAKVPYAKRMKQYNEEVEKWQKQLEKRRKKGEEVLDSIMPRPDLKVEYKLDQQMVPNGNIRINLPTPLEKLDTTCMHLYVERDSNWYRAPFTLRKYEAKYANDRNYEIITDWIPGAAYSFEVDTLAFTDIYGTVSKPYKAGIQVRELKEFATLFVNVTRPSSVGDSVAVRVQLLDASDKVQMESPVTDGTAEFYYLRPGSYFLRAYIDNNNNGQWDAGDFYADRQPEQVFYNHEEIECKANWDLTRNWTLNSRALTEQKPGKLVKQKGDKQRSVKMRNAERARQLGIALPE